ncbi:MAG: hypothetical protein USCGTAYLOR_03037 [Chromatiales bacterium USCg_Taylor]|nr:MAG: hypothetical protein USCGTAYLOR_03037 [Chromatiales bacterium USCg_Taylor]
MNDRRLETIEQVRDFLAGTEVIQFTIESTEGRYAFIHATLAKFRYATLSKADKGLIRRYLRDHGLFPCTTRPAYRRLSQEEEAGA